MTIQGSCRDSARPANDGVASPRLARPSRHDQAGAHDLDIGQIGYAVGDGLKVGGLDRPGQAAGFLV